MIQYYFSGPVITYQSLTQNSTCTALCDLYPCPKQKPICKHKISAEKQCLHDGYHFRSDHSSSGKFHLLVSFLELFLFLDPYTKFQPICEVDPFPVWAIIVIVVFVLIVILAALTGWFSILILIKVYKNLFRTKALQLNYSVSGGFFKSYSKTILKPLFYINARKFVLGI